MEIITGYTGRSHITPSLDASINSAIFGNNNVVLNFGDKLSFSSPTIGKIVIGSGALCFSGRIAVSENSEEKNYTPPATGEYSHCKIVARYKKIVSDGTNIESISLVLLQSVDSASSVTAALNLPVSEYASNVIEQSTTNADFVLYDFVVSEGGVVTNPVEPQFKVVDSIVSLAKSTDDDVSEINKDITSVDTKARNLEDNLDNLSTIVSNNKDTLEEMIEEGKIKVIPFVKKSETSTRRSYQISPAYVKSAMFLLFRYGRTYSTIVIHPCTMEMLQTGIGFSGIDLWGLLGQEAKPDNESYSYLNFLRINVYGGGHNTVLPIDIRVFKTVSLSKKTAISSLDFNIQDDFPELINIYGIGEE